MRPNLGDIEGIEAILLGIFRFHDLDINGPRRIFTTLNSIEKISSSVIRIFTSKTLSFRSLQVLDTLISLEVPLDVFEVAIGINKLKSVRRVTIQVTVAIRSTTVGEENSNLVNRFRDKREEIPESICIDWPVWVKLFPHKRFLV